MAVSGTLLIPNLDYGKSVLAVDTTLNGSMVEVTYIVDGELRAGSMSCVYNWSDSVSALVANPIMSGCTYVA